MGLCWYCFHGWPKPNVEIYDRLIASAGYEATHYGPAHIVFEDENFDTDSIQYCIDQCDKPSIHFDLSEGQIADVREALVALLAIPESIRDCCPADYDEENPALYPPPEGVEMEKR